MLTFATLFSGIGGWDVGLESAGMAKPLWMCEIGTFQRNVLAKRYPGVRVYEDVRRLHGQDAHIELREADRQQRHERGTAEPAAGRCPDCITERPDILVASPPCQDLSVAGKRAGLVGARSGLFFEFVRLAGELRPPWLLMEQVPGLLSSHGGADFQVVVDALVECGYGISWRVLDARHFGVPQRRRRVYLVGRLGAACPPEILFEPEGSSWDPAPSDEAGEDVAGTLGGGAPGARGWRGDLDSSGAYIPEVAYTLTQRSSQDRPESGAATLVARALNGTMGKHHDDDTDTLIAHTVHGEHSTAMQGNGDAAVAFPTDTARSLDTTVAHTPTPAVVALRDERGRANEGGILTEQAHTLHAMKGPSESQVLYIPVEVAHTLRASGFDAGEDGTGRGTPLVVESVALRGREGGATAELGGDQAHAVRASQGGGDKGHVLISTPLVEEPVVTSGPKMFDASGYHRESLSTTTTPTISAYEQPMMVAPSVRRLTPVECERLMGFPDGHTCLCDAPHTDERHCPDGPRYAACGNAVVTNVAAWIGRQLVACQWTR